MTPSQLSAIKADILADQSLSSFPNTSDGNFEIAKIYNAIAAPDFFVWQTAANVQTIFDNITWANYTPQDVPDNTATWTNRAIACQCKQINLQTMLTGRETINAAKTSIRAGLQDALTQLPSGASGATRAAGWVAVQAALQRKATRGEKVLSAGSGSSASPATMGFEGSISYQDIESARNS